MYDLRYESWIPWRRRSGRVEWGPIALLTDNLGTDPVVATAAPRPDFNGALLEFLVGLLTVTFQPADEEEWRDLWDHPPIPTRINDALGKLPDAFQLGGNGPRFLQDLDQDELGKEKILPVERLLFDSPGEQSIQYNADLFAKRERVKVLGLPAAAMALLAMQTYAPSGGKGHRTSLRGGGPLTTLVDPRLAEADGEPLWRCLAANLETRELWEARRVGKAEFAWALVFPWLAPTRSSDPKQSGRPTTPADAHPLQAYFGMPRRIRLEYGEQATCDLTGDTSAATVIGFRARPYGVEYDGWNHPLTPRYLARPQLEWLPVHAQPGGIAWKDWLGLTLERPDATKVPAQVVARFHPRGPGGGARQAKLHAFGVDFDNMKCRGWTEARLPLPAVRDETAKQRLRDLGNRLTEATELTAATTRDHVKAALFERPSDAKGNFEAVTRDVWANTESAFYAVVTRFTESPTAEALEQEARGFHPVLRKAALDAFDRYGNAAGAQPALLRRTVKERYRLSGFLAGYGSRGAKLIEALLLEVPSPKVAKPRTRRKSR